MARSKPITPEDKAKFLEYLAEFGNIEIAALKVKRSVRTMHKVKAKDPEFKVKWIEIHTSKPGPKVKHRPFHHAFGSELVREDEFTLEFNGSFLSLGKAIREKALKLGYGNLSAPIPTIAGWTPRQADRLSLLGIEGRQMKYKLIREHLGLREAG